jgi:mono/diheme cytochrome c family protein
VFREGPNLLANHGFETVDANDLPEGWTRRDYGNRDANRSVEWEVVEGEGNAYEGQHALRASLLGNADTSLYADVTYKPNTQYRLSAFIKARNLRGKLSLNDHINRWETDTVRRDADWTEVEVLFQSGTATRGSINVLAVGRGEGFFDNVRLSELLPMQDSSQPVVGDFARGQDIFFKHTAACVLCHQLKGEGSTVGPPLDGIASRKDIAYIRESLLEPSKVLAEGYENLGLSPMPPMGDIFTAQEMADIQEFVLTLKKVD